MLGCHQLRKRGGVVWLRLCDEEKIERAYWGTWVEQFFQLVSLHKLCMDTVCYLLYV